MEQHPFIKLAEQAGIKERKNMERVAHRIETREGTEMYAQIKEEIDGAIQRLNNILSSGTLDPEKTELLSLTKIFLDDTNRPTQFPTLTELEQNTDFDMFRWGVITLKGVNTLMQMGENPVPQTGAWVLHTREGIDEDKLLAATMIAAYAKFVKFYFESKGYQPFGDITFPLEEILAVYLPESYIFQLFREWYILEEGFSEVLVNHIKTIPIHLLDSEVERLRELSQFTDLAASLHSFGASQIRQLEQIGEFQDYVEKLTVKYGLDDRDYIGWHRQFID